MSNQIYRVFAHYFNWYYQHASAAEKIFSEKKLGHQESNSEQLGLEARIAATTVQGYPLADLKLKETM